MPRYLVDLSPLRESREYRLLYTGQVISFLGRQMTIVAVPFQVFQITHHSSLQVGLISLAALGPLLLTSLFLGPIIDSVDRRKLLLTTQVVMAATSAGLALNAAQHSPPVWPLYALMALSGGVSGIDGPTSSAILATLVRREQLAASAALSQIMYQLAGSIGPAIAGLIIKEVGLAAAYWIDVTTFSMMFVCVAMMRPLPPSDRATRLGLPAVREGVSYLRGNRVLQSTFYIDLDAMIFGMPRALFPAIAIDRFHGGAGILGLLAAAPGAGALIGATFTGWVTRIRRQGLAVVLAVVAWGLAIVAFGVVPWLPAALIFLAIAGAADVVSAVFRNTILQTLVPDSLRGRLTAIHIAVVTGGPRLGDAESGAVAALASTEVSVVTGGVACVLGVLVLLRAVPELVGYQAPGATVIDVD
jgi:MFS family permease